MTQENTTKITDEKSAKKQAKKAAAQKRKNVGGIAAISLLITLFDKLSEIICRALINGFWGSICSAYAKMERAFEHGFLREFIFSDKRFKKIFRRFRYFLSGHIENCFIVTVGQKLITFFSSAPLNYYGNFGFFFGVYTIVVYFVKQIIPEFENASFDYIIFGVVAILVSLPLIFAKQSLAGTIMNSSLARSIAQDCLGLSDEVLKRNTSARKGKGSLMLFFGLIAGTLSFFIHPLTITVYIVIGLLLFFVAVTPEIGVLLTIFIVPFLSFFDNPTISLCCCVLVTAFFYFVKIIRGKRIFKLELIDGAVLLFGIIIFFASIFSAGGEGSKNAALVSCALMLGYFLLVNLMRTEKWIKRCVMALVSSGCFVAILGVLEYFFGAESSEWLDTRLFAGIRTRVVSVFDNPNVLAAYLGLIFPFALVYLIFSKTKNEKFISYFLCGSIVLATVFTWSRGAWIAMAVGAVIFFTVYTKKTMRIFGASIFLIPILPMLLPDNLLDRIVSILNFSDSSISYRIYTWLGSMRAIKDFFWGGIGYGPEAFSNIYPHYAYAGIEAAEHTHSLYLQILLGLGIGGLLTFLVMTFLYFQKCSEYIKKPENVSSKFFTVAAVVSVIAALIMGVFDYIWFNYRVFFVFWIVLSIGCAFVRVGKSEIERTSPDFEEEHSTVYRDNG